MNIRKKTAFLDLYYDPARPILASSPELVLVNAVSAGRTEDACALFGDEKQFGGKSVIDAPWGRFEGAQGVRAFAETWLSTFEARHAEVIPVFQTRSGGRSCTELVVNFEVDGQIDQVPMFVIGDLRGRRMLDEVRIYCYYTLIPGQTPYRKPLFPSAHLEMGEPMLLTGAVREYYEALHHTPNADVERILNCCADRVAFGGYGYPLEDHPVNVLDKDGLREAYERMASYIPSCVGMRYETLIDDGVTGVIEWVHLITDEGASRLNRICTSGIAAYERNDQGLLCSIRICDYAYREHLIDWSKTPVTEAEARAMNRVKTAPTGVGRKGQTEFRK